MATTGVITTANVGGQLAYSGFASGTVNADIDTVLTIECGFQPNRIEIIGTSSGEGVFHATWFKGMPAGTFLLTVAAGTTTLETTFGPAVYAGDADLETSEGFILPVDFQDSTGLDMTDDDALFWIAYR